ncbi:MAG TPA: site-2 protease family protein [Chryseosolibacter sp.]|nr:site-2 protease family protein [Chryseosolibacter sp.]
MKYSLYLGRISGIKISVHWTFTLLILWIVISNIRSGLDLTEILWSIGFVLVIFVCVILHELGHALAARQYKIKTRDITILPIGGVAHLESMPEKPKEELVVALAGPLVNVIIAIVLFPFVTITSRMAEIDTLETIGSANFLPALMSINLWLALFNLIPAFPMDGGRVLRALLGFRLPHPKATRIAATIGQVLAIGFVFFGFFAHQPFMIFIGFFIFLGAQQEALYSRSRFVLHGFTVNDVLMPEVPAIPDDLSVKDAASHLLHTQGKNFIVTREGRPIGTLSRNQIIKALAERHDGRPVAEVCDLDVMTLTPDMPLDEAWTLMKQKNKSITLVTAGERIIGVVDEENITELVLIRNASSK